MAAGPGSVAGGRRLAVGSHGGAGADDVLELVVVVAVALSAERLAFSAWSDVVPQPASAASQAAQAVQAAKAGTEDAQLPAPFFLIALRDKTINAAAAYWVDGPMLNYVTQQGVHVIVRLDLVDRGLSRDLNRQRNVEFRLPE